MIKKDVQFNRWNMGKYCSFKSIPFVLFSFFYPVSEKVVRFIKWVRTVFRILIQLYVSIKMKENESKSKQN